MPKLYEYFGLFVLFYSNEHEPIHVHGIDPAVSSRPPLSGRGLKDFKALVSAKANDIVKKWVDFFVLKKPVKTVRITKRLA